MRFRTLISTVVLSLAATLSPYAMAQTGSIELVTKIPFKFIVSKKLYNEGTYTVLRRSDNTLSIQLMGDSGKQLVAMPVLTRLARQHVKYESRGSLVFDVIGDQYFLSEVWMPEVDGYQVSTTTQIHKHEFVEVKE